MFVKSSGEVAEPTLHDVVDDDAADINRSNISRVVVQRVEHFPPPARADNQDLLVPASHQVLQADEVGIEPGPQNVEVAVKPGRVGGEPHVEVDEPEVGDAARVGRAQPPAFEILPLLRDARIPNDRPRIQRPTLKVHVPFSHGEAPVSGSAHLTHRTELLNVEQGHAGGQDQQPAEQQREPGGCDARAHMPRRPQQQHEHRRQRREHDRGRRAESLEAGGRSQTPEARAAQVGEIQPADILNLVTKEDINQETPDEKGDDGNQLNEKQVERGSSVERVSKLAVVDRYLHQQHRQ